MELWEHERLAWNNGAETVCGVDEAGAAWPLDRARWWVSRWLKSP